MEKELSSRLEQVRARIASAAARCGRRAEDVTLVAVTKVFPASVIRDAYALGLRDFGENYLQEFEGKHPQIQDLSEARFHLTEKRFQKVHNWFERAGRWSLFFGYYIAGVRHFTAMVAGASALEYPIFAGFAYCGAFTWVLTFLSLGYFVGDRWQGASERVHQYILVSCIVLGAILGIYLLARYLWRKS